MAAFLDVTSFFFSGNFRSMVAGSFKLWGGVERCHTVLPPFFYRHALPVVVVLLRLLQPSWCHSFTLLSSGLLGRRSSSLI